jgi:hypothetical protein
MFDDGLFSRSQKYFWVINTLQEMIKMVKGNIKVWEDFKIAFQAEEVREARCNRAPRMVGSNINLNEGVLKCNELNERLRGLEAEFTEQREKAIGLRDGVSNDTQIATLSI